MVIRRPTLTPVNAIGASLEYTSCFHQTLERESKRGRSLFIEMYFVNVCFSIRQQFFLHFDGRIGFIKRAYSIQLLAEFATSACARLRTFARPFSQRLKLFIQAEKNDSNESKYMGNVN